MSDKVIYKFIRGDDFKIPMTLTEPEGNNDPIDISTWTIKSQVNYSRKKISDLTVNIVDAVAGKFEITCPNTETENWPARDLKCDIQFDRGTEGRISSETFIVRVTEDQTA